MKKSIIAVLSVLIVVTIAGCGKKGEAASEKKDDAVIEVIQVGDSEENATEESGDFSDLEALGDVEVDKNLFNVELTIPKDFVGETTQAELDKTASEKGYKSITLNADGSATYIITKKQHEEMLEELRASLEEGLNEMVTSGDYSFTDTEANDNYTDFTVKTSATELGLQDSISVMAFYMYGGMYNVFSGENIDNVHVTFVNADTGDVISQADSKDMQDQ